MEFVLPVAAAVIGVVLMGVLLVVQARATSSTKRSYKRARIANEEILRLSQECMELAVKIVAANERRAGYLYEGTRWDER